MLFVTWLSRYRHLAPASIATYIAAVRSWHIDAGLPDPTAEAKRLHRLMRGVRHRSHPSSTTQRLPITNHLLQVIARALAVPSFDHAMFWAASCTAFFGFLRVSEFTCPGTFDPSRHLGFCDVQLDPSGGYRLLLKQSKTDPFGRGCTVYLGPSGRPICPVAALSRYLSFRGSAPGPLFVLRDGRPLTPSIVNSWLRSILSSAGVHGNYSSHSFRIGAATSAALAGVPDHLIQALGRWSSDAYLRYIRTPPQQLLAVPRHLV